MALNYRFRGDVPNDFQILTDGVVALDTSGSSVLPDEFHVTEVRDITEFDIANGMDLIELENTRFAIIQLAQSNGYNLLEFDDEELLNTLHTPPRITVYSPTRGGTAAALTSNIVLTFTENVVRATSAGPTVQLINLTSNTVVETFAFNSGSITVSTNTATINPAASLVANNQYALLVDTGYFTNSGATEDHGGIHALNFYNFTAPAS